jgi:hypothetical protein
VVRSVTVASKSRKIVSELATKPARAFKSIIHIGIFWVRRASDGETLTSVFVANHLWSRDRPGLLLVGRRHDHEEYSPPMIWPAQFKK